MPRRGQLALLLLFSLAALALWLSWDRTPSREVPADRTSPRTERDLAGRPVVRILFIGNSLTSWNDLPAMVAAMSEANDGPVIQAEALVTGGADLGDHWQAGAQQRIAEGDWDFVVLQQGPSSLPESRQTLLEYARTYAPAIRAAGAEPAFYMVWPEERYLRSFDRACESYRLAAEEVDAVLLPAGEAWRAAWRLDSSLPLYGPDRFHPSPAGSYLAALVICATLTGESPLSLPGPAELGLTSSSVAPLAEQQVLHLRQAAEEAVSVVSPPVP